MNTDKIILPQYPEVIEVRLSPDKTPVAYNNKVKELIEECGMSQEEAEREVSQMSFQLEIIYEKNCGLFAVDNEALDCSTTWSPYTKKEITFKD